MPPKLSFFDSTFHCFQVWLADESNSRVAFLLGRTCFFFHRCGGPTSPPVSSRGRLPPAGWTS